MARKEKMLETKRQKMRDRRRRIKFIYEENFYAFIVSRFHEKFPHKNKSCYHN